MLYGDKSVKRNSADKKEAAQDLEYLQGMYPIHMKRLQEYVISACDHLDYRNSPMYDEFPDRILVNQVCDSICAQIHKDGIIADEQTAQADTSEKEEVEKMGWEEDEAANFGMCAQQRYSTWGPPGSWPPDDPPWGPPPGRRPPEWGPPDRPEWGPPGNRPPGWGPPGPPWRDPYANNGWLNGVISVLLLNEMHRRRCRNNRCW